MAEELPAIPNQRSEPEPLEDLTNECHKDQQDPPQKLRRTRSSRPLHRRLHPSESVPCFRTPIWDADAARSDDYVPCSPPISPTHPIVPPGECAPSFSLEQLDEQSDLPPPAAQRSPPQDNLPSQTLPSAVFHPTQLEPITEQQSMVSLRSSPSRSRLGLSPARNATVVHAQESHHSLHPPLQRSSPCQMKKSVPSSPHNKRVFSLDGLDDLDCIGLSSVDCSARRVRSSTSSCSDRGLHKPPTGNRDESAEARQTSQPRRERRPTPPDVSFSGSPDTVNYFNRPRARSSSWWRVGRSTQPNLSSLDSSAAASALAVHLVPPRSTTYRPHAILRPSDFLANNPAPDSCSAPRRATMPAGVLWAVDGTYVRGRFGARGGVHDDISTRGLDGYVLQRAANTATERNDNNADASWVVPRQSQRVHQPEPEMVMSGGIRPDNIAPRPASLSSLLTTWFSRGERGPEHQRETTPPPQPDIGPRIIDLAAGVDEFLGRNREHNHASNNDDLVPRTRLSTDTTGVHTTASSVPSMSAFWRCFRWPCFRWSCFRWFCICCCEMTQKELDGCGWYGANRPWLNKRRESVRLGRTRERGEEEGKGERREREPERNEAWNYGLWGVRAEMRAGLRPSTPGEDRNAEIVGETVRRMRYAAGGSSG